MNPRTIGVVGSGTMGGGIAQVAASAGHSVILADRSEEILRRSRAALEKSLERGIEKGILPASEKEAVLERIVMEPRLEPLSAADFVIEAVNEDFELKKQIFTELDRLCRPEV